TCAVPSSCALSLSRTHTHTHTHIHTHIHTQAVCIHRHMGMWNSLQHHHTHTLTIALFHTQHRSFPPSLSPSISLPVLSLGCHRRSRLCLCRRWIGHNSII